MKVIRISYHLLAFSSFGFYLLYRYRERDINKLIYFGGQVLIFLSIEIMSLSPKTWLEFLIISSYILVMNWLIFFYLVDEEDQMSSQDKRRLAPPNPYFHWLGGNNKNYWIQFGIYNIESKQHPSMDILPIVQPTDNWRLETNGYVERIWNKLVSLEKLTREKYPDIQMQIVRFPLKTKIFHKFVVILYTLISFGTSEYSVLEKTTSGIEKFDMESTDFTLQSIDDISDSTLQKAMKLDNDDNVIIDPTYLPKAENFAFELGSHEFDVFRDLIELKNMTSVKFDTFEGDHYIGNDLSGSPIWIDEPDNVIFLGKSTGLNKILNLEILRNSIILTDDERLIEKLNSYHFPEILDIDSIRIGLLSLGKVHPGFMKQILGLWASRLPADFKQGTSGGLTQALMEFLEYKYLMDEQSDLETYDLSKLFTPGPYRKFTTTFDMDIHNKVKSKYKGVFDMTIFSGFYPNSNQIGFDDLIHTAMENEYTVIDLSKINSRQKLAILLLFVSLKEFSIIPQDKWIINSFKDDLEDLESKLRILFRFVHCQQILFHFSKFGNYVSLLDNFDLVMVDAMFSHKKVRNLLGIGNYFGENEIILAKPVHGPAKYEKTICSEFEGYP